MLYGTDTWGLRENEVTILRRVERSIVRAMCQVKFGRQKEYSAADEHVGIEESSRSAGKGK